nr:reverse transcriptase domain-containing protein [Tanacetum cinerariifolium]
MIKSSHGDTSFSLTYRTKAVIPAEIGMPTYRTTVVDVVNNVKELRLNLDLLEERRELAAMSEARSKSKMMKYYNSRVRGVAFKLGDFIYRSNDASHAVAGGKLGPKWEESTDKSPYNPDLQNHASSKCFKTAWLKKEVNKKVGYAVSNGSGYAISGDATHFTKARMNFMVVKSMSPYNGIIGRPSLKAIQAVPSTVHGMLKFPVERGIKTIHNTILIPTECASVTTSSVIPEEERTRPTNFTVALHPDLPDQEVVIGVSLSDKGRTELCSILKKNLDIFAWQPSNMNRVARSVAKHRLNIREGYSLVRQKKRGQAPKRARAIQAEVQKLVDARIMREVYYHDWLSNPVMDCYPLPEIDWKVESLCGYPFKCFLDAYKGYHQIQLAEADEEKTAFHDLVVKSYTEAEMMRDIEETFRTLRKVNMKLNPKKCSFRLTEGVFLGTGNSPNADLLYKVRITGPGTKLLTDGEVGLVTGLRSKKTSTTLFTDGSSCVDGSGAGLILINPEGVEFTYALRFHFTPSNNEAEYEALVAGLRIAAQMGVKNVQVNVDSKLVANQVLGTYVAKEDNMIKYLEIVKGLVLVEVLENKSIKEKEVAAVIEEDGPTWMTQLVDYLKDGALPRDEKEARKLRLKARQYADYVMREIHEGSCSMHAGPRSVVAKAIWLGYYWLTMHKDARDMIQKCSDCQIHRLVARHPQQSMTLITTLWPFCKWGIDIAGPFSEGPGKVKFLIVAMDYFTKWIEAKAVATITGGQVKKFVWDNIVCRFGIPREIISDNCKQFSDNPFKDWCDKLNIIQWFASVKHPQSNGLVEELPHVLWAHRTMIKSSHDDTPFSLTYGTEADIPTEIGMPTYRTAAVDVVNNDEELRLNLDLLEERHFVYRSNDASHGIAGGKLGPKWEGPYEVTEALGNGAYKLRSTDGTVLLRTWNVTNLK